MNKIDFSYTGGFPFTQDTLNFMQDAYNKCFLAIGSVLGNKVIISGCHDNGTGVISAGVVALNGEILPTPGGSAATVFVEGNSLKEVAFEDGPYRNVYFTRTLAFGLGDQQCNWSEFVRLKDLLTLDASISALDASINKHTNDKNNPHGVTKDQVGLTDATRLLLMDKVYIGDLGASPSNLSRVSVVKSDNTNPIANLLRIRFPRRVDTMNYMVVGNTQDAGGVDSNWKHNACVIWSVSDLQNSHMDITFMEVMPVKQDLYFNYALIATY